MIKRGQFENFENAPLIMEPKDDSELLESDPTLEDLKEDQLDGNHHQEVTDSTFDDANPKSNQSDDNSTNEEQS